MKNISYKFKIFIVTLLVFTFSINLTTPGWSNACGNSITEEIKLFGFLEELNAYFCISSRSYENNSVFYYKIYDSNHIFYTGSFDCLYGDTPPPPKIIEKYSKSAIKEKKERIKSLVSLHQKKLDNFSDFYHQIKKEFGFKPINKKNRCLVEISKKEDKIQFILKDIETKTNIIIDSKDGLYSYHSGDAPIKYDIKRCFIQDNGDVILYFTETFHACDSYKLNKVSTYFKDKIDAFHKR